jgi:Transcriptional regulators
MATIADVAKEARVSRSTVSSVMTGRKYVAPETRQRVEKAVRKLRYTVNSGARALATSRTMTLGLVFSFRQSRFVPSASTYVVALAQYARAAGYRLTLLTGDDSVGEIERALAAKTVDGFILMEVVEDDPRLEPLRRGTVPAVLVGLPEDSAGVDAVDLDYVAAGRLAVDRVHAQGRHRVAMIGWPGSLRRTGATYALRFRRGVEGRARELGMDVTTFECEVDQHGIQECLTPILQDPSWEALVFHNDAIVPILPILLLRENVENLQVIGLCPPEMAREQWLPFETIDTKPEESAGIAVQMLLQRLAEAPSGARGQSGSSPEVRPFERVLIEPTLTAMSEWGNAAEEG